MVNNSTISKNDQSRSPQVNEHKKKPRQMTLEIEIMAQDSQTTCDGDQPSMTSQPSPS